MAVEHTHDLLVLGAGVAGLTFALELVELDPSAQVAVMAKGDIKSSATYWAQGGIAAVLSSTDDAEAHLADTMVAGAHLNNPDVVRMVVTEGSSCVARLAERGVNFTASHEVDKAADYGGAINGAHLTREGGHSARRIAHAGDTTGKEIAVTLVDLARAHPRIELLEGWMAVDLLTERKSARHIAKKRLGLGGFVSLKAFGNAGPEGWPNTKPDRCVGVYAMQAGTDRIVPVRASATVLATGGAGKVYMVTSNPDAASGDGIAMAWRAGLPIANMEFVQFHPTCLYHPLAGNFLITEALRGEGAVLRLPDGKRLMEGHDPRLDLAPRDIVARAIDFEMKTRGLEHVFLDATGLGKEKIESHFPNIVDRCRSLGIDPVEQGIPVAPAAHYLCGGVRNDQHGATELVGLYAIGEVTCSGLHGANRLASNSLLEGVVYGTRAAQHCAQNLDDYRKAAAMVEVPGWDETGATEPNDQIVVTQTWDEVRRLMWNYVGIVRTKERLARAKRRIDMNRRELQDYYWRYRVTRDFIELRNLCSVAEMIIDCATLRRESRGLHYNLDYPETDDEHWKRDTVVQRTWT